MEKEEEYPDFLIKKVVELYTNDDEDSLDDKKNVV